MTDLPSLLRAGHSPTRKGIITNRVRQTLLPFIRPYFVFLLDAITANARRIDRIEGIAAAPSSDAGRGMGDEQAPSGLALALDGLKADQAAIAHRLGSLEDAVAEVRGASSTRFSIDGIRKDQAALGSRLGALELTLVEHEDALTEIHAAGVGRDAAIRALQAHDEQTAVAMPAVAGAQAVLMPHRVALAVRGTSLVLHDGTYGCFLLRQPDLVSDHIIAGGFWDEHLRPVIERFAAADRIAVDVGAYLGFHTVYLAKHFRTVYAFEPQIEMFRILNANLALNVCRNVVALNLGLYHSAGNIALAPSERQEIPVPRFQGGVDYDHIGNAAALTFQFSEGAQTGSVPAVTLDSFALRDVGLIKVDAQGSDLQALRGGRSTIERCRPAIALEFERTLAAQHGDSLDDYRSFFAETGYAIEILRDHQDGKQIDILATPEGMGPCAS